MATALPLVCRGTGVRVVSRSRVGFSCRWRHAVVRKDLPRMQAMGLVNDHAEDCVIAAEVARARKNFSTARASSL